MKVGGQTLWNVTAFCETSQISYLIGRHHMRGHTVWSDGRISPYLRMTYRDYINLVQKSWPGFFRGCVARAGNLERRHLARRLKPFCPKKPTEFCFCLGTVIELIVVCRRVVSERSLWKCSGQLITTTVSSSPFLDSDTEFCGSGARVAVTQQ